MNTGCILVGGMSRRMGFDKYLLEYHQKPLLFSLIETLDALFTEVILVTSHYSTFEKNVTSHHTWKDHIPEHIVSVQHMMSMQQKCWHWYWKKLKRCVIVVEDAMYRPTNDRAAIFGLAAGLFFATNQTIFCMALDMPHISPNILEYLVSKSSTDAIVVPFVHNTLQPLFSVYPKASLLHVQKCIEAQNLGLCQMVSQYPKTILFPEQTPFSTEEWEYTVQNWNTPEEIH